MAQPRALDKATRARMPSGWAMFFGGFLKHPVMVGSFVPSSRALIDAMLRPVDWAGVRLFIEYGPGAGAYCGAVLDRLPADATYIAIDPNPDFIDYLSVRFTDARFVPVLGSAVDVERIIAEHGFAQADCVLSGLPFSTLPEGTAPAIAAATHRVLRPGGAFLVYQFRPKVEEYLTPFWHRIDRRIEWRNLPPSHTFIAWKD